MKEINIAATLIKKRRERGITQDEIAEYIGVSKASVSKWETGQSYPDITFLPQLAAYFNISIDELMNYSPQMTKEEIGNCYHRLTAMFASAPFNDVLTECRGIINKYYSCFPLLLQMALLLVNHHMLTKSEEEKAEILREAAGLCVRIKTESGDMWLAKEAACIQSICHLSLNEPQSVLDLLGETVSNGMEGEMLISQAYQLMGNMTKAKEITQQNIYKHLLSLYGSLLNYLNLCSDDLSKSEEILKRTLLLAESFDLDSLNPGVAVNIYIYAAFMYCNNANPKKAIDMLRKYVDICTTDFFPLALHGDSFFDLIDKWLSDLILGTAPPRSEKIIKESMVNDVLLSPVFAGLKEEPEFNIFLRKLKDFAGGDIK